MKSEAQLPAKFQRLNCDDAANVSFTVDGVTHTAQATDSLAAAMLGAGISSFRQSANREPRGPWCLMGACYECMVDVDGVAVQACMTPVQNGMRVVRRNRIPSLSGLSNRKDGPTGSDS